MHPLDGDNAYQPAHLVRTDSDKPMLVDVSSLSTMKMHTLGVQQGQNAAGAPLMSQPSMMPPWGLVPVMSIPTVQPFYPLPQPAYNLPPTNEQQASLSQAPSPSPSEVTTYAPQTQTALSTHMRPVSHGWPESALHLIAAKPTPLVLPGFVRRNVPQRVWDPYADRRSGKNARDVVIHYFPSGVTPLDTQRIEFDLAGQRSGTGIPLSLLDASHISNTLHYLVDANEPILIDRQRMERNEYVVDFGHSYNTIILCMAWPAYPQLSRNKFRCTVTIRDVSGYSSRARILKDVSRAFTQFFEYAQANPSASAGASSVDAIWAFGPGKLSFDRVWLVALYQMAGQYFLGEFKADIPQEIWDRRLDAAAVPMTY